MKKYLLDTNICIFFLKGKFELIDKIASVGLENCYVSEITVAEMRFGASNSEKIVENRHKIDAFEADIIVVPIYPALDLYANEKARLRKMGTPIDNFDLLIGVTSVVNDFVMVTNNTQHFARIQQITLEDWSKNYPDYPDSL